MSTSKRPVDSSHEDMWAGYFEREYGGERCIAHKGSRVRAKVGWRFYNTVVVTFLTEDGATKRIETVPAGKFNLGQTATGRRLFHNSGKWTVGV